MFQENYKLFILTQNQKPIEPLNLKNSRMHKGDFVLIVSPESPKISLYTVQSNQLALINHLKNEHFIEAAKYSIQNGAKHFKQVFLSQTTNTQFISHETVIPRCFLNITSSELKALYNACRLPRIVEELDELDELDCKLPHEKTSPLTISHQHSPMHEKHKQHDDAERTNTAYHA